MAVGMTEIAALNIASERSRVIVEVLGAWELCYIAMD